MTAQESKIFSFRSKRKWIWVLTSTLTLGLVYITCNMYSVSSEADYEFDDTQEYLKSNLQSTIRTIPPLYEIFYIIQSTGADFNPTIINDYNKYESYTISAKKSALNLGVYSTDIGYLSTYGKTKQALNYMDVCMELTKTVCAQDNVDFNVLERFNNNLSNPDSLNVRRCIH